MIREATLRGADSNPGPRRRSTTVSAPAEAERGVRRHLGSDAERPHVEAGVKGGRETLGSCGALVASTGVERPVDALVGTDKGRDVGGELGADVLVEPAQAVGDRVDTSLITHRMGVLI